MKKRENKTQMNRESKLVIKIALGAVITAVFLLAGRYYVNDYYHATDVALEALETREEIQVTKTEDYYRFAPPQQEQNDIGIIFYPGAKVEESAYAPMLAEFAKSGYTTYLMRMPIKLAILDKNAADIVLDETVEEDTGKKWILMGHSLGGAMAADYVAKHPDSVSGLVLLAAYSTQDLSGDAIPVLSIYGSEDGVLNRSSYDKYYPNLSSEVTECVIDGGNHAGYGFYGVQEGDGEAWISADEQQQTVVDALNDWIEERGLTNE